MIDRVLNLIIKLTVVCSLFVLVLETIPEFKHISKTFRMIDYWSISVYIFEFIYRTYKRNEKINIIDVVSIVTVLAAITLPRYPTLNILCWSQMFKLTRYTKLDNHIIDAFKLVKGEMISFSALIFCLLMITSSAMYYVENKAQPDKFESIIDCLWWSIVTLTTVGYGDVFPITPLGKLLASFVMVIGIGIIAIPTAFWTTAVIEVMGREKKS